MHQLHFTINSSHDNGDSHQQIISNIHSYVECNFSETTYWDYFEVLGYVNLTTNTIHHNESSWGIRFEDILCKATAVNSWNDYLGSLIKSSISRQEYPEYENTNLFYIKMKEYCKFLCSLKFLDSKIVSGPLHDIKIDYDMLPNTIQAYAGYCENQFDKLGVTDYGDSDDNSIIGILDIHF